jgi:indolepyruvate decarboxylase
VAAAVEGSDALLALGCVMGRQFRHLVTGRGSALLRAADGEVRLGKELAGKAELAPLVAQLRAQAWPSRPAMATAGLSFEQRRTSVPKIAATSSGEPGLTYDEALSTVSAFLDASFITLTDTSLSMYPAAELDITGGRGFLCNAVWQSIGYSVGAAVGVALGQSRRPLVICGDGGFQMTAQALSTLAAQGSRAIVLVLDNGQYGIEQWLLDPGYFAGGSAAPRPYLALNRWRYAELARAMGITSTVTVATPAELTHALAEARAATGPAFISVTIRRHDLPSELRKA